MPLKSKAQQRYMFAAEDRGELPEGTASRWAHHTKNIKGLPERKKKAVLGMQVYLRFLASPSPAIKQASAFGKTRILLQVAELLPQTGDLGQALVKVGFTAEASRLIGRLLCVGLVERVKRAMESCATSPAGTKTNYSMGYGAERYKKLKKRTTITEGKASKQAAGLAPALPAVLPQAEEQELIRSWFNSPEYMKATAGPLAGHEQGPDDESFESASARLSNVSPAEEAAYLAFLQARGLRQLDHGFERIPAPKAASMGFAQPASSKINPTGLNTLKPKQDNPYQGAAGAPMVSGVQLAQNGYQQKPASGALMPSLRKAALPLLGIPAVSGVAGSIVGSMTAPDEQHRAEGAGRGFARGVGVGTGGMLGLPLGLGGAAIGENLMQDSGIGLGDWRMRLLRVLPLLGLGGGAHLGDFAARQMLGRPSWELGKERESQKTADGQWYQNPYLLGGAGALGAAGLGELLHGGDDDEQTNPWWRRLGYGAAGAGLGALLANYLQPGTQSPAPVASGPASFPTNLAAGRSLPASVPGAASRPPSHMLASNSRQMVSAPSAFSESRSHSTPPPILPPSPVPPVLNPGQF